MSSIRVFRVVFTAKKADLISPAFFISFVSCECQMPSASRCSESVSLSVLVDALARVAPSLN